MITLQSHGTRCLLESVLVEHIVIFFFFFSFFFFFLFLFLFYGAQYQRFRGTRKYASIIINIRRKKKGIIKEEESLTDSRHVLNDTSDKKKIWRNGNPYPDILSSTSMCDEKDFKIDRFFYMSIKGSSHARKLSNLSTTKTTYYHVLRKQFFYVKYRSVTYSYYSVHPRHMLFLLKIACEFKCSASILTHLSIRLYVLSKQ